jgi:hypothetical protein
MKTYVVKSNRDVQIRNMLAFKGEVNVVKYNLSPWIEDNGDLTDFAVEVLNGQASVSDVSTIYFESVNIVANSGTNRFSESSNFLVTILVAGDTFYYSGGNQPSTAGIYTVDEIIGNSIAVIETIATLATGGYIIIKDKEPELTITTSESGSSLIKITATTATNTLVTHLRVVAKDPQIVNQFHTDYV